MRGGTQAALVSKIIIASQLRPRMYKTIIVNLFFILILFLLQASFLSGLPVLNNLNLILIILIFILSLKGVEFAFGWLLAIGFLLDIFSFLPFGMHLFSLFLTISLINFLVINFFTNRSLFSYLALVTCATILYEIFSRGMIYLFNLFYYKEAALVFNLNFFKAELYQLFSNLIFTIIIFYIVNFLYIKLKPVFLFK